MLASVDPSQTNSAKELLLSVQSSPVIVHARDESERQRHSRSSSAELTAEPLIFVSQRQRNAVSRREDDTDRWGIDELDSKEEHRLVLRDNSLRNTILSRLNTFRRNRELCDVILFVREREIIGHKVVLAAISNSLFELFKNETDSTDMVYQNGEEESRRSVGPTSMSYFEFNQGDYECFEALVDFAYTGVLSISSLKISDLYKTSFALQVNVVAVACARHLAENLSLNNCIGVRKHANFNNDVYLVDKVDSFIVENFEKIIDDSVEFTKLPCIKSRIIVQHSGHNGFHEELAASMAARAISFFQAYPKISDRVEQQIEALTQKSHLLFVASGEDRLEDCSKVNEETVLGSSVVIQDYKQSQESKSSKTVGHNSQPLGVQPVQHHVTGALSVKIDASRIANARYASNESLNSVGSSETDVDQEIESKLIALTQSSYGFWIALSVLYKRLVVLSIQLTDDEDLTGSVENLAGTPPSEMFKSGDGTSNSPCIKPSAGLSSPIRVSAPVVDFAAAKRQLLPAMSVARCSVGSAFLDGKIIVCGGYNRGECLKSVEEYDLETGKWKLLPPMSTERGRLSAAVANNKLYAVGGSDGNNDLQSVECYDPATLLWTAVEPLGQPRSNNTCTQLDGYIYCIGGSSDQKALRECERYNIATGKWESIAPMLVARSQSACTTFRKQIIVVGGCNRSGCLDSVEAYDPQTNTWKMLAKLGTPRRGCAVATCKDILFAIGGNDGIQSLLSSEALENTKSHWRPAPMLNTARANTNAIVTTSSIYLVGGFDNAQFLSTIEVMESEALGWRYLIQNGTGPNDSLKQSSNSSNSNVAVINNPENKDNVAGADARTDDDLHNDMRSESVTPRASTATIAVQ